MVEWIHKYDTIKSRRDDLMVDACLKIEPQRHKSIIEQTCDSLCPFAFVVQKKEQTL